jgi:hypothetical protein
MTGYLTVSGVVQGASFETVTDSAQDAANKFFAHASIQSSELMNIYSGNVVTDELGIAVVHLPDWFESENGDFRYQLTVVGGQFAQAIVSKEIHDHEFTISTNSTHVKVSWQVTGVRQDAYSKAHPLIVEQPKNERERGYYLHPELYGQPADKQIGWAHHPEMMRHMQALQGRGSKTQRPEPSTAAMGAPVSAASRTFHPAPLPAIPHRQVSLDQTGSKQ